MKTYQVCKECKQELEINFLNFYSEIKDGKEYFKKICIECTKERRKKRYKKVAKNNYFSISDYKFLPSKNFANNKEVANNKSVANNKEVANNKIGNKKVANNKVANNITTTQNDYLSSKLSPSYKAFIQNAPSNDIPSNDIHTIKNTQDNDSCDISNIYGCLPSSKVLTPDILKDTEDNPLIFIIYLSVLGIEKIIGLVKHMIKDHKKISEWSNNIEVVQTKTSQEKYREEHPYFYPNFYFNK